MLLASPAPRPDAVVAWVGDRPLAQPTGGPRHGQELHAQLEDVRSRGYSVDDQENEVGVNCLALPVYLTSPTRVSGAISVSALAYRTPLRRLIDDLPAIRMIVDGRVDEVDA